MENPKQIKDKLSELYPYRIELHAHSKLISPCGDLLPEQLVEVYHSEGYDALTLTNHFSSPLLGKNYTVDEYIDAFYQTEKAAEKYGMKIYFGAELRFDESMNDYLLFGVDKTILEQAAEYFPSGLEKYRTEVKLPRSMLVQAHPFRDRCQPAPADLLDGMEIFNMHSGHNNRNAMAVKYAKKNGISVMTAGTDYHHPDRNHESGGSIRVKKLPADGFELAELLRSGDYLLEVGKSAIILP